MIRPIDLADNISKAPYADRVNQVQRKQPETDQQAFHMQLIEKAAEEQSRPPKADEDERVRNEKGTGEETSYEADEEQENAQSEQQDDVFEDGGPLGQMVDVVA